jgi:5-methylcytosine-specific restriction endonuclease McrA
MDNKKQCSRCKEWKSFSEFHKDKRRKNGVGSQCAKCRNQNDVGSNERSKRWYWKHLDLAHKKIRSWRLGHQEYYRQRYRNREALERGATGKVTADQWAALKKKYSYTCLRCKRKEPEIKLTIDHVLPLVLGGTNLIENIQPLCSSCNSIKHAKHIDYR